MYSCHVKIPTGLSFRCVKFRDGQTVSLERFKANKLSRNLKKTKFMVFQPSKKRSDCDIEIPIDN